MLTIRREQMSALSQARARDLADRLAEHLGRMPYEAQPERAALQRCLERASGYGLGGANDLLAFVGLCAELGWEFDLSPAYRWAQAVLRDERVTSPSRRLQRLQEKLRARRLAEEHSAAARRTFKELPP